MSDSKISALLALSLISTPIVADTTFSLSSSATSSETISPRASIRRMKHQLATAPRLQPDYIHPPLANHIDAPLPETTASEQVVGIYGNILYPQDREQIQKKKLAHWIEAYSKDPTTPFPLSSEDLNDISLYILDRFPLEMIRYYFAQQVHRFLASGNSLENALEKAKQETLNQAFVYKEISRNIPSWKGRCEILVSKFAECADQVEQIVERDTNAIKDNPDTLQQMLKKRAVDLIEPPLTWDIRTHVFKQMIDKVTSLSPSSPYFLALQEVTPQALNDLKKTLADRNLQWISFNNLSGKETLPPQQEEVLGEATSFTSTLALSPDLKILKIELSDLPTESGSIRKILGVRVRNTHTNETFNLFTTHTDHKIQNDIYAKTATKIHAFATHFFEDAAPHEQKFVLGGDLNAFEDSGGDKYIETLRKQFTDSQDFRETDYYAPHPIAWSSFIGRYDDTYSGQLAKDGIVKPSALDHILMGNGIELQSASREAAVYDDSGKLLNYYTEPDKYIEHLQKRTTFSDHFFNIVRFK